jgi:menaquinone-9 beta-reductase
MQRNVIIIGGGLAGLTSAIHLCRKGLQVTLIEKHGYPRHKVCGEYISNEVLPYLKWLGADPAALQPAVINRVRISTANGKYTEAALPLGGFGVSRYALDYYLMQIAVDNGCKVLEDTVTDVAFSNDTFRVYTSDHGILQAGFVLGAYGKRAALDQQLERDFATQRSPWLAVKAHFEGDFPDGLVALHNFKGGYCGISKVEHGILNICYLVSYASFKQHKDIQTHREEVMYQNPHLQHVFENSRQLFDKPLTISQVSFAAKQQVDRHILMTGDTAGLIHPLCGNGMAMAIHSAKIAAEQVLTYNGSRPQLEQQYAHAWKQAFGGRMQAGRLLSAAFARERLSALMMNAVQLCPPLLPVMIRQTHGKLLKVD